MGLEALPSPSTASFAVARFRRATFAHILYGRCERRDSARPAGKHTGGLSRHGGTLGLIAETYRG